MKGSVATQYELEGIKIDEFEEGNHSWQEIGCVCRKSVDSTFDNPSNVEGLYFKETVLEGWVLKQILQFIIVS